MGTSVYTLPLQSLLNLRSWKEGRKAKPTSRRTDDGRDASASAFPELDQGESPPWTLTFLKPGTAWFSLFPYKGLDKAPGAELDETRELLRATGN